MAVIKLTKREMFLRVVPLPLQDKYISVSILFTMWLCFFDANSLIQFYKMELTHGRLKDTRDYYVLQVEELNRYKGIVSGDTIALERIAREKYFMKKMDEDIFIVITPE